MFITGFCSFLIGGQEELIEQKEGKGLETWTGVGEDRTSQIRGGREKNK